MSENKEKSSLWRGVFSLIVIVLFLVRFCYKEYDSKASMEASHNIRGLLQKQIQNRATSQDIKDMVLNLSFDGATNPYRDSKILAVVYDFKVESNQVISVILSAGGIGGMLVPAKNNEAPLVMKLSADQVDSISQPIFKCAEQLVPKMKRFTRKVTTPQEGYIRVYIRTSEGKTFVQDFQQSRKYKNKNINTIISGIGKVWETLE